MTLSEFILSQRVASLLGNVKEGWQTASALRCENGLLLSVQASASHRCSPRVDSGPWAMFEVQVVEKGAGTLPMEAEGIFSVASDGIATLPARLILEILEKAGWPEAQLGKMWRKAR